MRRSGKVRKPKPEEFTEKLNQLEDLKRDTISKIVESIDKPKYVNEFNEAINKMNNKLEEIGSKTADKEVDIIRNKFKEYTAENRLEYECSQDIREDYEKECRALVIQLNTMNEKYEKHCESMVAFEDKPIKDRSDKETIEYGMQNDEKRRQKTRLYQVNEKLQFRFNLYQLLAELNKEDAKVNKIQLMREEHNY